MAMRTDPPTPQPKPKPKPSSKPRELIQPLPLLALSHGGEDTEMVEVSCRDGGRPTHTEQTGARAGAHVVSK